MEPLPFRAEFHSPDEYKDAFRAELYRADERAHAYLGNGLQVRFSPHETYPFTYIEINRGNETFREMLLYAHLALGRMLTEFDFRTVLEIGSRTGTVARAMEFAGKDVLTIEVQESYDARFTGDYLDLKLDGPIDAIWCSHVLEHQRHVGLFCEKMFDDLRDGGVLGLTVPADLSPLVMGHPVIFTSGVLLYNLVLAGFDCSEAAVKVYEGQISVLLVKKANGIPRKSFAVVPFEEDGVCYQPDLYSYFPAHFRDSFSDSGYSWGEVEAINWPV
jgi:hypothetical protein